MTRSGPRATLWLPALALLLAACASQDARPTAVRNVSRDSSVITTYAPQCRGAPDLTGELEGFHDLPLEVLVVPPTLTELTAALERAEGPWLMFLFSGHGKEKDDRSHICLRDGHVPVNDLLRLLSTSHRASVRGAVLVLNACESAMVDPSVSDLPVSVISASPYRVRTDSLFGESIRSALELAAEDWNCDGTITDQELFDALLAVLERTPVSTVRPLLPKLRRQAPSDIPLPFRPHMRQECVERRSRLKKLAESDGASWGELGAGLRAQLALSDFERPPAALPASARDYYYVETRDTPAVTEAVIAAAARAEHLAPLPESARPHAEELARTITFAQIYRLEVACGLVRVVRLSDRAVVGVESPDALARALPPRTERAFPRRLFQGARVQDRVIGMAAKGRRAVPCYEQTGQCFEPQ